MTVFAYRHIDPLLDVSPDASSADDTEWGQPVDRIYQDLGDRHQFNQLITDCQTILASASVTSTSVSTSAGEGPSIRLIIRHLGDLGDSIEEVGDRLCQLENLRIDLTVLEQPNLANGPSSNHSLSTQSQSDQSPSTAPPLQAFSIEQLQDFQALHTRQRQRNLKRGHAQNRLQAKPPPGRAPYGYRRGKDRYILDRSTAPVVKDFFDHFLLYGSLRRSVRYLAQKYNKKISVSTGQRWLSNPVYRGNLAYTTGDVILNTHQAILSDDEAAQIDRLLRRNRQLPRRSASAERSLAGLVRCAECQSQMTITRVTQRGRKKDYLYLRPTQCPHKSSRKQRHQTLSVGQPTPNVAGVGDHNPPDTLDSQLSKVCTAIPYNQVLNQTIENICQTLPKLISQAPLPDLDTAKQRIQAQITEKLNIIDQLPNLKNSGILDTPTVELRRYTLQGEISALQSTLAQLPPVNLQATIQA
ncbi:MAG: hypothetical protein F6K09_17530, partial [Merismopedia sp. SIO2A8]|nr:hypothetical protein [Merismopedia sp. SIO2A8]